MMPTSLYNQIVRQMPNASVEAIIKKEDSLLFLKRNNPPVKGEWWFAGGRIRKGETLKEALYREVKEETGLMVDVIRFVGVYNRIFADRHDISIVFLCKCYNDKVVLNGEHSMFKFFVNPPEDVHPFLLQAIVDSKWKTPTTLGQ